MDVDSILVEGVKILIEVDLVQETTGGGILLPPSVRENQQRSVQIGTVLKIGPDAVVRLGKDRELKVGDRIFFARYGGYNVDIQEASGGKQRTKRDLRFLNDEDVLAVILD